jgi:hypothetical protein
MEKVENILGLTEVEVLAIPVDMDTKKVGERTKVFELEFGL